MKVFNFRRIHSDGKRIFGTILHNGNLINIHTLENYAKRIKTGEYLAKRDEEGKYTGYWELQGVAGRTEIIAGHEANFFYQLDGCFGLGKEFGFIEGEPAILRSREAVKEWLEMTKNETEIKIIVEEPQDWKWIA